MANRLVNFEENNLSLMGKNEINKTEEKTTVKFISNTCLYNYNQLILEDGKNNTLYTIDMRTLEEYKLKHFKGAIYKNNEEKLKEIEHEMLMKKKSIIVFYDNEKTQSINRNIEKKAETEIKTKEETYMKNNMDIYYMFIQKYFRNTKAQFYVLKDGFNNFEKEYPFLCLSQEDEESENTNATTPKIIAFLNYPFRIFENIYLGNFIHMNNPHVFRFLKIKHIYDFTSCGFSKKMHHHVHYRRYDVFSKKFRKKNFSAKEPITYSNFLNIHFMHDVIYNIAKHDKIYQKGKWEGEKGYLCKDANVEIKTEAHEENSRENERKEKETKKEHEKKENIYETENKSANKRGIISKLQNGAQKENEVEHQRETEKGNHYVEEKLRNNQEQKKIHEQKTIKKNIYNNEEKEKKKEGKSKTESETETETETESEIEHENEEKQNKIMKKNSGKMELIKKRESEEYVKEKQKVNANAIIILCNEGIKNQTKTKINSISLIICMCYTMFRNRCNENFAIARFLKICNELEINAYTYSFLKSFYHFLQNNNFCLEHIREKKNEQLYTEENIGRIGSSKENPNREKDQGTNNEHEQTKNRRYLNRTYYEDSDDSENSDSRNDRQTKGKNIKNKVNIIEKSEVIEDVQDNETCNRKKLTHRRSRTNNLGDTENALLDTLLEISRNETCKRVLNSFTIKNQYVIFGENENNIIYIKKNAPEFSAENKKDNDSSILINKELLIYNILNKISCDYEHMLASILYNIYNRQIVEIKDVETCIQVLFEAIKFEKYSIFVTMPYISLILFNICILKKNKIDESDLTDTVQIKIKKKLDEYIVCLLQSYIKNSIIYILHNLKMSTRRNEFKITFHMTKAQLDETSITKEIYLVIVALKYFLITLLHFYLNRYIENLDYTFFQKFNNKVLKRINEFADCYYSIFYVDIYKFLKPNYFPEVDPYDNLPYHFSDILRPFILLHNYFTK